jgi:hypothetical protein
MKPESSQESATSRLWMRLAFSTGCVWMAAALVAAPLLGQRGPTSPQPPWVLETRNVIPLDVPVAVREAVRWDDLDPSAPIGAVADLNDDGISDYILKGVARACGTGGCLYVIMDGRSARSLGSVWGNPLVVRAHASHGFQDIDAYSHGGASSGTFTSHAFDGSQYVRRSSRSLAGREVTILFETLNKIQRWPPVR